MDDQRRVQAIEPTHTAHVQQSRNALASSFMPPADTNPIALTGASALHDLLEAGTPGRAPIPTRPTPAFASARHSG